MIGEFCLENSAEIFGNSDPKAATVRAQEIYDQLDTITSYMLVVGTVWLGLYYIVSRCKCMPYFDRTDTFTLKLNNRSPPQRFSILFRDFDEYAMVHVFLWCLKDVMWQEDIAWGYMCIYVPTFILLIDVLYLSATHRGQFMEFAHSIITVLWLLSNGLWAYGELVEDDDSVDITTRHVYSFPSNPTTDTRLHWRYAAGCVFVVALTLVMVSHMAWMVCTHTGVLPLQYGYETLDTELSEELVQAEELDSDLGGYESPKARQSKVVVKGYI
ncbi:hypothetical protein SARC_09962 [Sphaeroforma arctica JP610]|uniref:Uncharacterized protein n=1 Tax=Sphaeroforma arctica JP610 TaxID=667725 RepID=A0A0L0FLF9_9EUKA|nr:hypothetical protein SARC_09962 [Sphaeroforma arctica JP610]KNC77580.1 hypothetical protein SARC_09962 [Sphaeroforma arctica JP610]|eukprot:XP_014151482.1 hypothetical protein SARC_09962 [Sphaeroforma arctica JP610]